MNHPFLIGMRPGRLGSARSSPLAAGRPDRPGGRDDVVARPRRALPRSASRCLWPALVLALASLSACTVRLELAEHRFAKGDLAARSMGLAGHERLVDGRTRGVVPTAPQRVVARRHGRVPEPDAAGNDAGRIGSRLVTLADNLALAGPNSLARPIASLSGGTAVAPALGPPEIRLAASRAAYPGLVIGEARSVPRPSPEKPGYSPGPTRIPELKPMAWRARALRRSAPPPPPARPSMAMALGWRPS